MGIHERVLAGGRVDKDGEESEESSLSVDESTQLKQGAHRRIPVGGDTGECSKEPSSFSPVFLSAAKRPDFLVRHSCAAYRSIRTSSIVSSAREKRGVVRCGRFGTKRHTEQAPGSRAWGAQIERSLLESDGQAAWRKIAMAYVSPKNEVELVKTWQASSKQETRNTKKETGSDAEGRGAGQGRACIHLTVSSVTARRKLEGNDIGPGPE